MAIAHYRYLILKMSSPNGVLKVCGDHNVGISALEKLQALAAAHETAAGPEGHDPTPPSLRQHGSISTSRVHPSGNKDVPVKTVHIGTDAAQTTRNAGNLDSK
jgi:hypothetical protein